MTQRRGDPVTEARGSVSDGDGTNRPSGHYWDRLDAASSAGELDELEDELRAHGYREDGQIRQAVEAKRGEVGGARRTARGGKSRGKAKD